MIIGIGTDIMEIARMQESLQERGEAWARRLLTDAELLEYEKRGNKAAYLAKRFAAKEAAAKGCKTIEGAPITIIQAYKPSKAAVKASEKIEADEQRARDADARRILEQELAKDKADLAQMQKDYNNGQPEREGGEKNYQKYLDRVADMKAAIERKQADIQAIQNELDKMPAASPPQQ